MILRKPDDPATLPDLLRPDLGVVFVGINPSLYSAAQGHYFARRTNRFWPALSRSTLSLGARTALDVEVLLPEHDRRLPEYGFGFTDAVKRASARADEITPAEFAAGVKDLLAKLEDFSPRFACFHGIMAFRPLHRTLTGTKDEPHLGLQELCIGKTRLFLAPNPSGANAHFTPADQTRSYDELAGCLKRDFP
ncbi:MAG TPA: mismatch-specific DNA-glycosylase [Methylovirgula sp.]